MVQDCLGSIDKVNRCRCRNRRTWRHHRPWHSSKQHLRTVDPQQWWWWRRRRCWSRWSIQLDCRICRKTHFRSRKEFVKSVLASNGTRGYPESSSDKSTSIIEKYTTGRSRSDQSDGIRHVHSYVNSSGRESYAAREIVPSKLQFLSTFIGIDITSIVETEFN